jgi:hypothetical protein
VVSAILGVMKEFQRTCNQCQCVWYVPEKLAKERQPLRSEMFSARLDAMGSRGTLFSRRRAETQLRLLRLEEKQSRVLKNARCPHCGSGNFIERRTWETRHEVQVKNRAELKAASDARRQVHTASKDAAREARNARKAERKARNRALWAATKDQV